jgi:hypothetical protein
MPAVQAIKVLEAIDDDAPSTNIRQTPGLIIQRRHRRSNRVTPAAVPKTLSESDDRDD